MIQEKCNDVDYIMNTPGQRKLKQLCHINMLKSYHHCDDVMGKPLALATVVEQVEEEEPDAKEETICMMRLNNSNMLKDLDKKFGLNLSCMTSLLFFLMLLG